MKKTIAVVAAIAAMQMGMSSAFAEQYVVKLFLRYFSESESGTIQVQRVTPLLIIVNCALQTETQADSLELVMDTETGSISVVRKCDGVVVCPVADLVGGHEISATVVNSQKKFMRHAFMQLPFTSEMIGSLMGPGVLSLGEVSNFKWRGKILGSQPPFGNLDKSVFDGKFAVTKKFVPDNSCQ
jgi:hypothetical protein